MPNRDAVILTNGGTGNVEVERMMSAADDDLKERPKERGQPARPPVSQSAAEEAWQQPVSARASARVERARALISPIYT